MSNPYQSLQSRVADVIDSDIEAIAGGQELANYAIGLRAAGYRVGSLGASK